MGLIKNISDSFETAFLAVSDAAEGAFAETDKVLGEVKDRPALSPEEEEKVERCMEETVAQATDKAEKATDTLFDKLKLKFWLLLGH